MGPSENAIAGIAYSGFFGESNKVGKIVNLGFPLECVYDSNIRDTIFNYLFRYFDAVTNTVSLEKDAPFTIYPNPAKDTFTLSFTNNSHSHTQVQVVDVRGKIQKTVTSNQNTGARSSFTFNVSQLISGFYFVLIRTPDHTFCEKLVITE